MSVCGKEQYSTFFSGISLKMCEGKLDQDLLRSTRCLQSVTMLLHVICVMSFTLLKLRYKWIVDLDLFSLRIERYYRQLSSRNYQFFLLCATLWTQFEWAYSELCRRQYMLVVQFQFRFLGKNWHMKSIFRFSINNSFALEIKSTQINSEVNFEVEVSALN